MVVTARVTPRDPRRWVCLSAGSAEEMAATARSIQHELCPAGLTVRIYPRHVRADGLTIPIWVVVARAKTEVGK